MAPNLQLFANNPEAFRNELLVDVDGTAKQFGEVMDDWQRKDFKSLDPGLLSCIGRNKESAKMRAYLERPRGHSKTTDLAVISIYALAFSTRPIRGFCFAADKDQANLLKDAISRIVRLNPWLSSVIDIQRSDILNSAKNHPGFQSTLSIFPSDVGSSYGILPDLLICDELVHWQGGDGALWNSILSSAAKRKNCLLCIISNAGFCDSWQWNIREAARTDEEWIFSRLDGPTASWLDEKRLDEQRRMLPTVAFNRLWLNQWSSGGGDALLPTDIDRAFNSDLQKMTGTEPDFNFVAGVDLGLTRDCSAVICLGIGKFGTSQAGKIRLADDKLWIPKPGFKIDLTDVENYIKELDDKFHLQAVAFDSWQAEHLAQRLEADAKHKRRQQRLLRAKPWMIEVPPTGQNLREIASILIETFQDYRIQCYDCETLKRDLFKLRIEERAFGFRLTSPRDETGHGDTASAFSLALKIGHEEAGLKRFVAGALQDNTQTIHQSQLDQFNYKKQEYESIQSLLSTPEDEQEVMRQIMYRAGRTKKPYRE